MIVEVIEVAAAVILRADGSFLMARRPVGKLYAGSWEFPGGKIEPGELPAAALARELHEELGMDVTRAYPWITRVFTYPHGTVRLRFFRVVQWKGDPQPREGQSIEWQRLGSPLVEPMLPANAPVLASLALPSEYAVTNAAQVGVRPMLAHLERRLAGGLKLLQIREPDFAEKDIFSREAIGLAHRHGAKVLTKTPQAGADGVHFTAAQLMALKEKPKVGLVAASCHTREELEHAMRLELDFAVLGSLKATATHPSSALGWEKFKKLIKETSIPVYAIGGLTRADLEDAWSAGAHGLAMIRGAWG